MPGLPADIPGSRRFRDGPDRGPEANRRADPDPAWRRRPDRAHRRLALLSANIVKHATLKVYPGCTARLRQHAQGPVERRSVSLPQGQRRLPAPPKRCRQPSRQCAAPPVRCHPYEPTRHDCEPRINHLGSGADNGDLGHTPESMIVGSWPLFTEDDRQACAPDHDALGPWLGERRAGLSQAEEGAGQARMQAWPEKDASLGDDSINFALDGKGWDKP